MFLANGIDYNKNSDTHRNNTTVVPHTHAHTHAHTRTYTYTALETTDVTGSFLVSLTFEAAKASGCCDRMHIS